MSAFESEDTARMSRALYQAVERLRVAGRLNGNEESVRASLSRAVLDAAAAGETDEEQLVLKALAWFEQNAGKQEGLDPASK